MDKKWINRCRKDGANDMTVLSFPALYTWRTAFGLSIDGDEEYYLIKSTADRGYYYPVGRATACRSCVLRLLEGERPLRLVYVPKGEIEWLKELGFDVSFEPDTSEYVYSSRSLALLDKGAGTNYRVKVRHFSRDYQWCVRRFSFPEDDRLLREMVSVWDSSCGHALSEDWPAVLACCDDPAAIGLSGVHIETADGEWAFLLGYPSTDQIYDMSIVRYSPTLSRNAVPVCICETAKLVCGAYPYINLEDDLGVPGIRMMKKLYNPLFLLDSYSAHIIGPPKG